MKTRISTTAAPLPAHGYSQGVRVGTLVQTSGQLGIEPTTHAVIPEDVAAQTTQALENVKAIVEAAGARFDDVITLRVYLTKRENFEAMNGAYRAFVSSNSETGIMPTRTTTFVTLSKEEFLVEIEGTAIVA